MALNFLETTGGTVKLVSSYDSTNGVSFLSVDTSQTALFDATTGATSGILGAERSKFHHRLDPDPEHRRRRRPAILPTC